MPHLSMIHAQQQHTIAHFSKEFSRERVCGAPPYSCNHWRCLHFCAALDLVIASPVALTAVGEILWWRRLWKPSKT